MKTLIALILVSISTQTALAQNACLDKIGKSNMKALEAKMLTVDNNITKLCDENRIKDANDYARTSGTALVNSKTMQAAIKCDQAYASTAEIFLANPDQNICD